MDAPEPSTRGDVRRYGRRTFLLTTAAGFSSLFWGSAVWSQTSKIVVPIVDVIAPGLIPGWRIYTVAGHMPKFDRRTWRLRIDGLVEQPVDFTYDQLLALPRAEQVSDFHCVTGWAVDNVHWAGVRFRDLLAVVRPTAAAEALTFVSAERPYFDSLTLDQALLPDVMLAYEMDGEPLTQPHGAPVRLVIPEMYGYKGVKWVEQITLAPIPETGYWEQRGWEQDAWIGGKHG
jgi:DMSO/TMAO reductase YedYZ molybdopterin-dependent catalytic subunit